MEKDSAKLRISQIIKSYFKSTHIENSDYQGELASSDVNNIVDQIEPDYPKVKLPRKVGEELDAVVAYWKREYATRTLAHILVNLEYDRYKTYHPNLSDWYDKENNATAIIADAYRYGWEAEPEAKWYVQTPKEWWEDKNKPEYVDLDSLGISDGLKCKEYATKFTRAEITYYHFDSDLFTLVPVGEEK